MYRKHFGLTRLPFKSSPDISVFYKNGSRQDILEALVYTVVRGDGITKVTGEVGSGKTMLLRLLAESLPKSFSILYINAPNLSAKDMLMYICTELNLKVSHSALKFSLLSAINNELLKLHAEGKRVVMLIDEAQAMTFDTLEEIRLLSNLETSDEKLLQIVLFGQPELDVALGNEKIRQLKSRISYSIFIPPLSPVEVNSYLNYRMRKASYDGLDLFDMAVSKQIHTLSKGMPRTINMLADKLLMAAYSSGDRHVTKKHVLMLPEAINSSAVTFNLNKRKGIFLTFIGLLVIAVVYLIFDFTESSMGFFGMKDSVSETIQKLDKNSDSTSISEVVLSVENPINSSNSDSDSLKNATPYEETLKQETEFYIVKDPKLLNRLVEWHLDAVQWLEKMPEQMYVIQLAGPHVKMLDETIKFYAENQIPIDSLHFLIDLGKTDNKNRLRVLYLASDSYSTLQSTIASLPPELKRVTPYVETVGQLVKNLEYTQNNLIEHGIINVSQ